MDDIFLIFPNYNLLNIPPLFLITTADDVMYLVDWHEQPQTTLIMPTYYASDFIKCYQSNNGRSSQTSSFPFLIHTT